MQGMANAKRISDIESGSESVLKRMLVAMAATTTSISGAGHVWASQPEEWGLNLQAPATESARQIQDFHAMLMIVIVVITILVTALLAYVMWRFRASRNPTPSQTSHNTLVEVVWTVAPVIVLVLIAIPSFNLLYFLDRTEDPELTIKVNGHQWYWSYEYPDQGGLSYFSNMVPEG